MNFKEPMLILPRSKVHQSDSGSVSRIRFCSGSSPPPPHLHPPPPSLFLAHSLVQCPGHHSLRQFLRHIFSECVAQLPRHGLQPFRPSLFECSQCLSELGLDNGGPVVPGLGRWQRKAKRNGGENEAESVIRIRDDG